MDSLLDIAVAHGNAVIADDTATSVQASIPAGPLGSPAYLC